MDEAKDLQLIDQALTKFGIATDEQFGTLVSALLPPLVEKLASPSQAVRSKILKVLTHVNQRYKAEPTWKLPTNSLLALMQSTNIKEPLVCNFTICYLMAALDRESEDVQVPTLVKMVELAPATNEGAQQHIFSAFVNMIDKIRIKGASKEVREARFSFFSRPEAKKQLMKFAHDFLLFTPTIASSSTTTSLNPMAGLANTPQSPTAGISPGHSIDSQAIIKTTPLSGIQAQLAAPSIVPQVSSYTLQQLGEKKIGLILFFKENMDLFVDSDLYLAAVISATDALNDVQRHGDDLLKRMSKEALSDKAVVTKLFSLFLGESGGNSVAQPAQGAPLAQVGPQHAVPGNVAANTQNSPWKSKRTPVSYNARFKILELLCRTRTAATMISQAVQLLFASLFGESNIAYPKLQYLALGFSQNIIREATEVQLKPISPFILSGLSKYLAWLKEQANNDVVNPVFAPHLESLRIAVLHNFSSLGKRSPSLFSSNITLIEDLMRELRETKSVVLVSATQEALISLCPAISVVDPVIQQRLKTILASNFEQKAGLLDDPSGSEMQVDDKPDDQAAPSAEYPPPTVSSKFIAQFYANRVFPFSDSFCRYLNLLGVNDTNAQVVQEAKRGLDPFIVIDNDVVPLITKKGSALDDSAPSTVASNASNNSSTSSDVLSASSSSTPATTSAQKEDASSDKETKEWHLRQLKWPSFSKMVEIVNDKRKPTHSNSILSFPAPTFQSLITFLHSLLKHHRSKHPKTLETPITNWKVNSYTNFFSLLLEAVCTSATTSISHIASEVMLETIQYTPLDATDSEEAIVLGAIPEASINRQLASNELLSVVLTGNLKFDTMKLVARVLGLLALKDAAIKSTILDRCFGVIEDRSALKKGAQVGAILVSACTIATALRTNHPVEKLDDFVRAIQTSLDLHSADKMQHHGPANHIILASSEALGAMAKWSPQVPAIKAPGSDKTVLSSVLILLDSHDVSVVITAAYSIANMCLGDRSLASSNKAVIDGLLATFKVKGEESHFSIGEALSNVIAGWTSASSTDTLVVSKDQEDRAKLAQLDASNSERELGVMESTLQIVLQEYLLSSRPDTRMASAIWLLTILKNCGAHPELVKNLKQIQAGFTQLLSDSNEILQEVAGKGLSQVYELGDESTKKELVDLLVGALQKGSSSFKVTAESEIFSPGQLGTTPSGDKLTTYRELVTLAAEMNQPDLIYKFMQLSAHNSLWNSKKGAAFATGELASRAKAQIAPHLPQLIPKLYRTSFDPNPKIAASMTSLMTTLVTDQKSALSSHIHEVLRDLLDHIIDSQWRTREACCNALADLLPARDYEEVASELKELWERCFRVLDDIKESVRKAGEAFKKSLSNLTLRLCDPSYTNREHGRMALEVALPHLVGKGLLSPVKEVRNISINMLLKISKVSSFLLKPHIARIIPVLLRSLATLDSTSLNYLEQHASAYGISAELFDEARVAMSKSSPVHATIDFCVQQVDAHNILDLSPELATLLSADNHVSTRAGSAHVITQLALSRPEACRLVAHKLMLSLKKGINARALQVRRSYGYAMGQLARYAKKKTLEIVVNGLLDSYKNSGPDDTDLRAAIAEALLELSKASAASVSTITPEPKSSNAMDVSPDGLLVDPVPSSSTVRSGTASTPVLAPMLNVVVPVVFLARFDAKEETSKVFNKIWEECGASLALYVNETVSTFSAALESSSWQMKQQGARAIAKFSEILNLSQFTSQAPGLLQMLLGGLKGRTWTGKESLLDALSKLVSCCAEMWAQPKMVPSNRITPEEILKVISGEVVRKTLEYRKAALLCLTDVLNTFNKHLSDFDGLSKVKDLLLEQATQVHVSAEDGDRSSSASSGSFGSSNNTTSTEEKKDEESAISRSIRLLALQALCAGFPVDQADRQRDYLPVLIDVLSRTFKSTNQYIVKVGVVNNLKVLFPKISQEAWTSVVSSELLTNIVSSLFYPALGDLKYSVVRSAACVALIELLSQAMEPPTPVIEQLEKAVLEADKIGQSPVSSDRLLSLLARAKN